MAIRVVVERIVMIWVGGIDGLLCIFFVGLCVYCTGRRLRWLQCIMFFSEIKKLRCWAQLLGEVWVVF